MWPSRSRSILHWALELGTHSSRHTHGDATPGADKRMTSLQSRENECLSRSQVCGNLLQKLELTNTETWVQILTTSQLCGPHSPSPQHLWGPPCDASTAWHKAPRGRLAPPRLSSPPCHDSLPHGHWVSDSPGPLSLYPTEALLRGEWVSQTL